MKILLSIGMVVVAGVLAACGGAAGGGGLAGGFVGNATGTYSGTMPDGAPATLHIVDHGNGRLSGDGEMWTYAVTFEGTRTGNAANLTVFFMGTHLAGLEGTLTSTSFSGTLKTIVGSSVPGSFHLTKL